VFRSKLISVSVAVVALLVALSVGKAVIDSREEAELRRVRQQHEATVERQNEIAEEKREEREYKEYQKQFDSRLEEAEKKFRDEKESRDE
jgi:hypothetical protein